MTTTDTTSPIPAGTTTGTTASTLVDEVGIIAAEQVATILAERPGNSWPALVAGGWHALGADLEDGADLRALQEVARVTGRHPVATPLLSTLLAGRWTAQDTSASSLDLDAGVALVVSAGDRLVVPYGGTTEGLVVLEGDLSPLDPGHLIGVDGSLSLVMPVVVVAEGAGVAPVTGVRRAELLAVLAAAAAGCADSVVDRAASWVQTREQFGQAIGRFQAVRHHLADMHVARELAWTAALAAGQETDRAADWARQTCDLASSCIEMGIQVHGGVGFTWEVGLQHFLTHVMQIRDLVAGGLDESASLAAGGGAS